VVENYRKNIKEKMPIIDHYVVKFPGLREDEIRGVIMECFPDMQKCDELLSERILMKSDTDRIYVRDDGSYYYYQDILKDIQAEIEECELRVKMKGDEVSEAQLIILKSQRDIVLGYIRGIDSDD
jgi:hypothetical protein